MKNLVLVKSFPNGLSVKLDPDAPFEDIYREMGRKFREGAKFYGNAKLVISFEGRELGPEEEYLLVNCITDNTDLTVLCIMGKADDEKNVQYLKASNTFMNSGDKNTDGQFYKGTLRAGEILETDSSIIVLGDVHPGAKVISGGNVVILGTLYGQANAGANGNSKCFIVALDMKPTQIRIGEYASRAMAKQGKWLFNKTAPKIAYVLDEEIITDAITKELLENIPV